MTAASRQGNRILAVAAAVALSIPAVQGWASAQEDAADIRDKPIDKAQRKLGGRGYQSVQSGTDDGMQYWWNRDQDRCLEVHVAHGRVTNAEVRDEKNCRKADKHAQSQAARPAQQGVSSLIGMRASYLDGEMESRGYRNKGGHQSAGAAYTTWWNGSTRECLSVATREGRVDTVEIINEGNCN